MTHSEPSTSIIAGVPDTVRTAVSQRKAFNYKHGFSSKGRDAAEALINLGPGHSSVTHIEDDPSKCQAFRAGATKNKRHGDVLKIVQKKVDKGFQLYMVFKVDVAS